MLFKNNQEEAPLYYFEKISQIPRESGNEKAVSDYIFQWAKDLGLEAYQDKCFNLIIKKAATKGLEKVEPVILQAHLDMVCEKNLDSTHDFVKDPIAFKIENGWLVSANGTTLGADDGIGVGYIMAILAEAKLEHPPIEAIFTTQEETTFCGAENVDWSKLSGNRLINLDHAVDDEVLCGSCGGVGIRMSVPLERESYDNASNTLYRIQIGGLEGGHSGEDIHRGRGSAIQILNRVFRVCVAYNCRLVSFYSGTSRTAIPREAQMIFYVPSIIEETVIDALLDLEKILKKEYEATATNLFVNVQKEDGGDQLVYSEKSMDIILQALTLFPNGIMQMNGAFMGMVESSINLGIAKTCEDSVQFVAEARGGFCSTIDEIKQKVLMLAKFIQADIEFFDAYLPWSYKTDSLLRDKAMEVYKEMTGEMLKPVIVHAGIECGSFVNKNVNLDAISLGPTAHYFHSPKETLLISSALREWEFLKKLLKNL